MLAMPCSQSQAACLMTLAPPGLSCKTQMCVVAHTLSLVLSALNGSTRCARCLVLVRKRSACSLPHCLLCVCVCCGTQVLEEPDCKKLGMGLFLGVAQGSDEPLR